MDEQQPQKSSKGCFFYGCMITLVLFVLVGGLVGYGIYSTYQMVYGFTSDAPEELPTVEVTPDELSQIEVKVDQFNQALDAGETPAPLELSAREINALMTKDDELKGKIYVTIENGQIGGKISIPLNEIPGFQGRYFNAAANFDVTLENGVLVVLIASAEVKGEPVPAEFIEGMRQQNLARDVYKDPEKAKMIRRFKSLEIRDDVLILTPHQVSGSTPRKQPDEGEDVGDGEEDAEYQDGEEDDEPVEDPEDEDDGE